MPIRTSTLKSGAARRSVCLPSATKAAGGAGGQPARSATMAAPGPPEDDTSVPGNSLQQSLHADRTRRTANNRYS